MIDKLCSLLTSPTGTATYEPQTSNSSQDQSHHIRTPLPPPSTTTGVCKKRQQKRKNTKTMPKSVQTSAALPTDIHTTRASYSLSQPPPPPLCIPPSSSPQQRNSCGAPVSPPLPQQSGPPACSPTTAVSLRSAAILRLLPEEQVPSPSP